MHPDRTAVQARAPVRVAIVDYRLNNIRSVLNALQLLGAAPFVASEPAALVDADRIVLPGVGAFGDAMANLKAGGWLPALERRVLVDRAPFLGICLGMQLLASTGTEHGVTQGLGWIEGRVERLPNAPNARVPHIGWNDAMPAGPATGLFAGLSPGSCFYYVHSYALVPSDPIVVTATCQHGEATFVAALQKDNIYATQFHPEKSQKVGLALLARFLEV